MADEAHRAVVWLSTIPPGPVHDNHGNWSALLRRFIRLLNVHTYVRVGYGDQVEVSVLGQVSRRRFEVYVSHHSSSRGTVYGDIVDQLRGTAAHCLLIRSAATHSNRLLSLWAFAAVFGARGRIAPVCSSRAKILKVSRRRRDAAVDDGKWQAIWGSELAPAWTAA